MKLKSLFETCVAVAFASGTCGFVLKFASYIESQVYLPRVPNAFDVAFLLSASVYLGYLAGKAYMEETKK